MGTVIRFPDEQRMGRAVGYAHGLNEGATIVILPVVRIERHDDGSATPMTPGPTTAPGSGRRRRGS